MSRKVKLFLTAFIAFTLIFINGSSLSVFANEEISTEPDETETTVEQEEKADLKEENVLEEETVLDEKKETNDDSAFSENDTEATISKETDVPEEVIEPAEDAAVPAETEITDLPAEAVTTIDSVQKVNNAAVRLMAAPANDGGMLLAAADDSIKPYGPGTVIIPFTKIWIDTDKSTRPESITIKLYRFKGETYTDSDLFRTVTLSSDNENREGNWYYEFVFTNKLTDDSTQVFYKENGTWKAYNFAVVEDSVTDYLETDHIEPSVKMITYTDDSYWNWIRPKSVTTYDVITQGDNKNFLAAKKGNQLYVWTPEILSETEEQMILDVIHSHPQFPHDEEITSTDFYTGFGHYDAGGFTMTNGNPGNITFDTHSSWSFWALGTYSRSTTDQNAGSITNTVIPKRDVKVTKVWNDDSNKYGLRPEELTLTLSGAPEGTDVPDPEITKSEDGNSWVYTWANLPKIDSDGEEIAYTVSEDNVPAGYTCDATEVSADGTITNTLVTETKVVKEWKGDENYPDARPEELSVTLMAGDEEYELYTLTEADQWTAAVSDLPKFNSEGEEIEYTWTEPEVPEGYKSTSATEESVTTITNTYTPPAPPAPPVVKINKVDDKGNPVKGAELAVKDGTGKVVIQWTTDGTTYTVKDLEVGAAYTLTEIKAPAGYEKAADIKFAPGVGETITLNMVDKKIVVPDTSDRNNTAGWTLALFGSLLLGGLAFVWRRKYSHH